MPQSPDPGWFYSSLAQVTAALVGFMGGFVILRLVAFMSEWRESADRIRTTGAAYHAKRAEWAKAEGNPTTTPAIEYEQDRLWNELIQLLTRRDAARFPRVISWLAAGLLVLAGVGIAWPLVELEGPSNLKQWAFLIPWALVMLLVALGIAWEAFRALRSLRQTRLSEGSEAEYETFMLQFEGS